MQIAPSDRWHRRPCAYSGEFGIAHREPASRRTPRESIATHARRSRSARREHQAVHGTAEEASLTSMPSTRRLAELNAKVEDPSLWNDAEAAQKIMRERTDLEERLGSIDTFERRPRRRRHARRTRRDGRGRADREGRRRPAQGAQARRRAAPGRGNCSRARSIPTTPHSSRCIPAPAGPSPATGRACCSACTRAGASATNTRSRLSRRRRATRPASSRRRCWSRATTLTAGPRSNPACIGLCASRRSIRTRAGTPASPRSGSIR